MINQQIRSTPGARSKSFNNAWKQSSSEGTALYSSLYYDPIEKKDIQQSKAKIVLNNFLQFSELSENNILVDNASFFLVYLIQELFTNSIEIPDIQFSDYEDGIDIKINGDFYKILITVYEEVYAFAYRDNLKNRQSMQNRSIIPVLNSIINIYKDQINDKNLNYSLFSDIQNGWLTSRY